jgi:two-component system, OmpR family, phosphate regulon sensor histidine kinase PhoR
MKQLILRILCAVMAQQAAIIGSLLLVPGSSLLAITVSIVSGLALFAYIRKLVQPLRSLEESLAGTAQIDSQSMTTRDLCNEVQNRLKTLEQQLERQTVQLAEYKERFDAVLSGMIEGVIAIDEAGGVQFLNRAARMILSIDIPDVIGKPLIGLVRYEAVQKATREALETHRTVDTTFQTYERDRRDVRLRVSPMAGNPLPGMTLVFHDITALTRLETIRRDFVANVSHELKTPLSSIKANAETLLMGAIHKSPDNMRFLKQIDQQAETLNQQIQDLLQLARIESGRQAFSLEWIDLVEAGQESVERHQEEARKKEVQLSMQDHTGDEAACLIWADRDAIRTILDNLVSNALRYSHHHGTGRREATVSLVVKIDGSQALVEIIDNGIGIAPEHQARIFERFFRVDPARSRELGGTGLGLAIVKHLAQSFQGRVEVISKLGIGSTFRLAFPRLKQNPKSTA